MSVTELPDRLSGQLTPFARRLFASVTPPPLGAVFFSAS